MSQRDGFFAGKLSKKRKREESSESDSEDPLQDLPLAQRLELKKFDSSKAKPRTSREDLKQEVKRLKTRKQEEKRTASMPAEMSSKIPVSRKKQVIQVHKHRGRDPRFDSLSGNFNEELFKKSYSFLEEVKQQEMKQLRTAVKKTADIEEKGRIKKALEIMESREQTQKKKEEAQKLKRELRRKEAERVAAGKKPFYIGRTAVKEENLKRKYQELKDKGQLESFMKQQRKKVAAKQHRLMPK